MVFLPLHSAAGMHLPLPLEIATAILGLGVVVFVVVAYDIYQRVEV